MIVVSIGTDRKIFEQGSEPRARMIEYGKLFTELHIIVFTRLESDFKAEKISDNVWIYPTNSKKRIWYPFDARKVFTTSLKEIKPAVVTSQDPFEAGLAGWLIHRKIPAAKLHMQIHTDFMSRYFANSWLNRIRVMLARFLLPKANGIRAVSDRIKDSLAKIDPALPARTTVLPIYTDISKFKDASITVDLHTKYPQFSFIILMASRLTPEKNIGLALSVVRNAVIKNPKVGLVIVGDGSEKRYLEGLVLRYHLDRNVVFQPWQSDLVSYYRTADVFLTTSLYEGYGLTLVEAAAAGCPIISSDVGIARQIIEDGKNGFVCHVQDESDVTEKLVKMIESRELTQEMKHNADIIAHERVSEPKEHYLQKYKQAIEQL